MTLCPVALVVGCKKCPAFKICPLKAVIGDLTKEKEYFTYERTVHGGKYWKLHKRKETDPDLPPKT